MLHRVLRLMCIVVALSLASGSMAQVPQQPAPAESLANPQTPAESPESGPAQITDIRSLWQLTELGGGIRWLIFAVFAIGVFFTSGKMLELSVDKVRSRRLERYELPRLSLQQIEKLVSNSKPCLVRGLFTKILGFYDVAGPQAALHEEISSFVEQQQERFSTFRSRMIFLADTAGALGLLGTVWGMFLTFFGGNLDSQRILNGMGIALITTLLGLVVSIVLNFASTELHGFFNRRLDAVTNLGEALRMELLRRGGEIRIEPPVAEPVTTAEPAPQRRRIKLRSLSPTKISAVAGSTLPEPLAVQANLEDGTPYAGGELVFEVVENGGFFKGEQTRYQVRTDHRGRAAAPFRLSAALGTRRVMVSVKEAGNSRLVFEIEGLAGPPAQASVVAGNHQSGRVKQPLPQPLAVRVVDDLGNPVAGTRVVFNISRGEGRFQNGKNRVDLLTDEDGRAEAHFTFGDQSGVHEVTAVVEGLEDSPLHFDSMAQP